MTISTAELNFVMMMQGTNNDPIKAYKTMHLLCFFQLS